MAIVNFAIPLTLEKRIQQTIKNKGFVSKAEFFRFAAIYFMDVIEKPFKNEDDRFLYLTENLTKEIQEKHKGKKLPSLEEQLSDV